MSPIPGTTRDVVEVILGILLLIPHCVVSFMFEDIGGYPVILNDTAGLRTSNDPIESIGINLAKERLNFLPLCCL